MERLFYSFHSNSKKPRNPVNGWIGFFYNKNETKFLKYKEEKKMEELAKKIIQKVRSMYKYDTLLKDIVKTSAKVTV